MQAFDCQLQVEKMENLKLSYLVVFFFNYENVLGIVHCISEVPSKDW
jgi:hypothetical protein